MTDTTFSDSYIGTDAALEALIGDDPRASIMARKEAVDLDGTVQFYKYQSSEIT